MSKLLETAVIEKLIIATTEVWLLKCRQVYIPSQDKLLSSRYSQLLMYLYENKGRIVRYSELLNSVWGCEYYVHTNITVTLCALRRIFKDEGFRYFKTVRTHGILLDLDGGL